MQLPLQSSEFTFILKPSPIEGIGVFATHDIPQGALLFMGKFKIRLLKTKNIPAAFKQYCVYLNDNECLGPENFDHMEIGWFINHSKIPNITRDTFEYTPGEINQFKARPFIAIKNIKAGDEILVNYAYLNEPEHLKENFYR